VERVTNSVRGGACHAIELRGVGGGWGRQDLPLRGHRGQGGIGCQPVQGENRASMAGCAGGWMAGCAGGWIRYTAKIAAPCINCRQ